MKYRRRSEIVGPLLEVADDVVAIIIKLMLLISWDIGITFGVDNTSN
jgi:hypothetical protein